MKLAYLGYDKTVLKAHPVLEQYFNVIDSYLVNTDSEAGSLDLLSLPIMANNVCIPMDETLQTIQHKLVLQEIKNEYAYLKKNIFLDYKLTDSEFLGAKKALKKQLSIKDVVSIMFDRNLNKHFIQTKGAELEEYDYIIVQAHQLVTDQFQDIKQNIISRPQIQKYSILNIEFAAQYSLNKYHLHHEFIFIDNMRLKTIFDNWYICSISQNKFTVGLYIPFSRYDSNEFLEFITNRTYDVMSKSFESFKIGELLSRSASTSDGFVSHNAKLRYPKKSSVFPSFDYWPQNKINDYIKNLFIYKNKKNRNLFAEKEIS